MLPFLFGTALLAVFGLMLLYDPFRVGAHLTQLILSMFLSSALSWALWLTGNIVVVSFYATNIPAWDASVITAMTIGSVAVRWATGKIVLSDDSHLARDVSLALIGALAGALFGRYVLSELFPSEYTGTGISGSARVTWVWAGAMFGGHAHAAAVAVRRVLERREPCRLA